MPQDLLIRSSSVSQLELRNTKNHPKNWSLMSCLFVKKCLKDIVECVMVSVARMIAQRRVEVN